MITYPVEFKTQVLASSGIQTNWHIQSQDQSLICSIPPEFEGPGQALSPEDLYAQALTNCFVATFKVYAEKSRLEFNSLKCNGQLTVDLDENKKPWMKSFTLHVEIQNANNPEKTQFLADKAFKSGFILNSVKTELNMKLQMIN